MRFHATLARPDRLKRICSALSSLRPTCCMRLNSQGVQFVSVAESGAQIWSTRIKPDAIFDEYTATAEAGDIGVEINPELLLKALQRTGNSILDMVTFKLRKRQRLAFLQVKFETPSKDGTAAVHQEISVKIMKPAMIEALEQPIVVRDPDVYLKLPAASITRIIERYKRMSPRLTFSGNKQGIMSIAIEGESVNVESTWKQVEVLQQEQANTQEEEDQAENDQEEFAVTVDSREAFVLQPGSVVGICHEQMLVIQEELCEGCYLMYYLSHHE